MKKNLILPLILFITLFSSCKNDDDAAIISNPFNSNLTPEANTVVNNQINSFIYKTLNTFYLYKDEQSLLENNRFDSDDKFTSYIRNQGRPEDFFETLTVERDRFSFIRADFEELEDDFNGVRKDNGLKFNLNLYGGSNLVVATVTDVVSGSPAEDAGITRGQFFNKINGTNLNRTNFSDLLALDSYTIGLATYDGTTFVDTDESIELSKVQFIEAPISISKVLTVEGTKIGYILYNQFVFGSEAELNAIFANFKSEGIKDLVLDFRYNGGGSISTAVDLSTMVTGQFKGEVFYRQRYNQELQSLLESRDPENLVIRFSDKFLNDSNVTINSLNLSKVHIITTKRRTASASELVINGLKPFIDVVIIGEKEGTVGKTQGSRTFYDSENFNKENVNPSHKYALQPLIVEGANRDNVTVPNDGLTPTIIEAEDIIDLGILGDENEPLLKVAIDDILGKTSDVAAKRIPANIGEFVGTNDMNRPTYQRMYVTP